MQWLIVGLGNPGTRYNLTRHNAGFLTVELLAERKGWAWSEQTKFEGKTAGDKALLLLKPETFMNASGVSLRKTVDYLKIPLEKLIVVHDDLDLPLGQAKVAWAKGPHVHNGLLSIEHYLGTKQFWRVRLGVDSRTAEERRVISGERYVLRGLSYEEKKLMNQGVERAIEITEDIMKGRYATHG